MLKQAIDVYNFLLDIIEFIKKPSLSPKAFIVSTVALILTAGSLLSLQAFSGSSADEQARQAVNSESLPLAQQSAEAQKKADKTSTADVKPKPNTTPVGGADDASSGMNTGTIDTRPVGMDESKASKSFYLPITKNDQYDVGTVISYDAIKDEKTYYGGDLIFSTTNLTISKSNAETMANTFKVSPPDSANANLPAKPTEDNSPYFTVSLGASQPADTKNSYNMIVELLDVQVPVGTYQLHIATKNTEPSAKTLWYHGFITVNVVE